MAAKHTPGPWSIRRAHDASGDIGIKAPDVKNVIAECFSEIRAAGQRDTDVEANALLIAAAPDMLAALHLAEGFISAMFENFTNGEIEDGETELRAIRAAIAKAGGRS